MLMRSRSRFPSDLHACEVGHRHVDLMRHERQTRRFLPDARAPAIREHAVLFHDLRQLVEAVFRPIGRIGHGEEARHLRRAAVILRHRRSINRLQERLPRRACRVRAVLVRFHVRLDAARRQPQDAFSPVKRRIRQNDAREWRDGLRAGERQVRLTLQRDSSRGFHEFHAVRIELIRAGIAGQLEMEKDRIDLVADEVRLVLKFHFIPCGDNLRVIPAHIGDELAVTVRFRDGNAGIRPARPDVNIVVRVALLIVMQEKIKLAKDFLRHGLELDALETAARLPKGHARPAERGVRHGRPARRVE